MRRGICLAGNMSVDMLYGVPNYPALGELVHIREGFTRTTGGSVNNVSMDLAMLDPALPVQAMGRVGPDADGDFILAQLGRFPNIDTANVVRRGVSSFTIGMSDERTAQRTFFTYLGASGEFCEADVDWSQVHARILHVAYILLLNALDQLDPECGTKLAHLLRSARAHGLQTSVDVVSEASDRFTRLVPPALRYADYCVINEFEAQQTTGIPLRGAGGRLLAENLPAALESLRGMGVKEWAIIHSPEGGFGMDARGRYVARGSLRLPEGYIQGATGAGDAFCAGVLYTAEGGGDLADAIDLGIGCAAASLSAPGATEGMRPLPRIRALLNQYERRNPA